jgi:hypothetical protein
MVIKMDTEMVYRMGGVTALTQATKKHGDNSKKDEQQYC